MQHSKTKRIVAMIGVIAIISLFLCTIVFLLIGKPAIAITFVAVDGFVCIVLYFALRFHQNAIDANEALLSEDYDPHKDQ